MGKHRREFLESIHMEVEDLGTDFLKNHSSIPGPWKVSRCSQVHTNSNLKISGLLSAE